MSYGFGLHGLLVPNVSSEEASFVASAGSGVGSGSIARPLVFIHCVRLPPVASERVSRVSELPPGMKVHSHGNWAQLNSRRSRCHL